MRPGLLLLGLLAGTALSLALFLAQDIPDRKPPIIRLTERPGADARPADAGAQARPAAPAQMPAAVRKPAAPPALPKPSLDNRTPATPGPAAPTDSVEAWLKPGFGLADVADQEAAKAVLRVAETLDFRRFDQELKALVARDSDLARYLMMDFRAFLRLDNRLVATALVEQPYLQANRATQRTDNWVAAYFAGWGADSMPSEPVRRGIAQRARQSDPAALALITARPGWFQEVLQPDQVLALRRSETGSLHQLRLLPQLHRRHRAITDPAPAWRRRLQERLAGAGDPMASWLSTQLAANRPAQSEGIAPDFRLAVQAGYLGAVQEVRRRARGQDQGRWSATGLAPSEAHGLLAPLAATQPGSPVLVSALCELAFMQGDAAQAWSYLQAYTQDGPWASEVEDLSCLSGSDEDHQKFADTLVRQGVITRSTWAAHAAEIAGRRARIRGK